MLNYQRVAPWKMVNPWSSCFFAAEHGRNIEADYMGDAGWERNLGQQFSGMGHMFFRRTQGLPWSLQKVEEWFQDCIPSGNLT